MGKPPIHHQIYKHTVVQYLVNVLGLNITLRSINQRVQEFIQGEIEISAGTVSATYSKSVIPGTQPDEQKILNDLVSQLNPDDVFWDIGADKGLYTCLAGDMIGSSGEIVAFEPHPVRRNALKRNLKRNSANANVRGEALSNKSGTVRFGYRVLTNDQEDSGHIEAELISGDILIKGGEVPIPSVLKIDVEGAELNVLQGLSNTLEKNECRLVYCELHDRISEYGGTEEEVYELLNEHGFSVEEIGSRENDGQKFIRGMR